MSGRVCIYADARTLDPDDLVDGITDILQSTAAWHEMS